MLRKFNLILACNICDKINMHQTFYIDINEEITSIIERIKKARTNEIIMVVPKRALLIQSIVNLKILKKEADERKIQLMVITQDKLGKILIEKAGILVQQKMNNIVDEEVNLKEDNNKLNKDYYKMKNEVSETNESKKRLNEIGSETYFDEEELKKEASKELNKIKEKNVLENQKEKKEKIINKELVVNTKKDIKKRNQTIMDVKYESQAPVLPEKQSKTSKELHTPKSEANVDAYGNDSYYQNKKIENFFYQPKDADDQKRQEKNEKNNYKNYAISKKMRRWFLIFGIFSIVAVGTVLAYLFIPKASITIIVKPKTKAIDSEIMGEVNIDSSDVNKGIIPARIIKVDPKITKEYKATGNKSVSNQKARGTVTIYNEYSSSPQPLVATTRLLSANGKLFRLIKGVTVPGTTIVDGQMHPGSIQAQAVADEAGSDFNIGPNKFTIPGFKSRPNKYNKFYAKSDQAMSGGGDGNEKVHAITQSDIDNAKNKILADLNNSIKQKIKNVAGNNIVLLDDAINKKEAIYKLSDSLGEIVNSFQITADMPASAMVINQNDLKKMVAQMLIKAGDSQANINDNSVTIDFGKTNVNFNTGIMNIRFHAVGQIKPDINVDMIKKAILGKNETDLKAYLSTYPDIKNVNIEYQPSFISGRIPFQSNRVKITLDNSD